ncbi:MAG: glycosyltransferase family 39 protein [Candidatus Moraniibacteriota bacterium]
MSIQKFLEKNYKLVIGIILAFIFTVSVLNAWWDSAIFDETAHIPAGYSYLTMHDMRLNPEHPPLLKDLAAFPLLFLNLNFDTTQNFWTTDINGQWVAGHNLFWLNGNNSDLLIFWARIPFVLLSLLFGLFIFKWSKELAGTLGGLLALTLYAFDPNILGHNHFVTTDLGIAGFMMLSFYYFLKFIKDPSWKNVTLGGLFLALVQLTKFSSIMLFPIFGLVAVIYPLVKKIPAEEKSACLFKLKKIGEYLGKSIVALTFSLLIVWLFYAFNNFDMPKEKLAETINFYFTPTDTENVKNIYTNKVLLALNETALFRPLSEYFLGIAMVFKRVAGGNGAYFMGQVSNAAFPAYFPTVFALKEPLIILLLMLFAAVIGFWNNLKAFFDRFKESAQKSPWLTALSDYLRHNIEILAMFAFILLYAYISITGNLNIGFRHLFPILPFAYILTAKIIIDFCEKRKNLPAKILSLSIVLIFSLLLIIETVTAYPYYMSYFNQTAGGPKNGYNFVTDSNADWGQDLKRLQPFLDEHPEIDKIRVDYFGGADIKYYVKDKYIMWYDSKRPLEAGWYAISTNFLQGSIYDATKKDQTTYRWTQKLKPQYQVGTSLLIYHVSENDLKNLN